MQDERTLARGTAVVHRCARCGVRPQVRISTTFSEHKEARDPDSDVETRQDFWSIMGDYIYRKHVAPRTKLFVLGDDFPYF